jgi:hypothetical protein
VGVFDRRYCFDNSLYSDPGFCRDLIKPTPVVGLERQGSLVAMNIYSAVIIKQLTMDDRADIYTRSAEDRERSVLRVLSMWEVSLVAGVPISQAICLSQK